MVKAGLLGSGQGRARGQGKALGQGRVLGQGRARGQCRAREGSTRRGKGGAQIISTVLFIILLLNLYRTIYYTIEELISNNMLITYQSISY